MSTALSIAFTGLCAIIGNGDGKPGEILLVDARGIGEVGGVALPEHAPTLVVSLRDLANPASSAPTRVVTSAPGQTSRGDQLGLWDLTGTEVRIRPQGGSASGLQYFRPSSDDTSWPDAPRDVHDPASWRDLRFVPNMTTLVGDGRVDPSLIDTGAAIASGLPRPVAARIRLDAGLLQGSIPSQEAYRDDIFDFKSGGGSTRASRQPLTDTVQWTLQSDADAVIIDIIPVSGGPAKRLLLAPSAMPHRLFISNLPTENRSHADAHHGMSDEEMGALHFGAYYKLLMNEPRDKPLPEPWRPVSGRRGAGLMGPTLCPPAMFTRQ
jgi:hypothetical protein